jgi:sulfate adenylyltransferase subunit 1
MRRDPLPAPGEPGRADDLGVLRFMTCGSVDDGKSTLIGRLLHDSQVLLADTLDAIARTSRARGLAAPDLALLTDGLLAEREQGITIDVAHRYAATARRKFIIADSPGHEQYTRNMVTAASTADAAVLLVDARHGLRPQTRRHAAIAALMGVRMLVLAVNKMDLVDGSQPVFEGIAAEFRDWIARHGGLAAGSAAPLVHAVPVCALRGDMVAERGQALGWYQGPTLLDLLEAAPSGHDEALEAPLRLPVQWVCRPAPGPAGAAAGAARAYAGRLESGRLAVGEEVLLWPSGQRSRVAGLAIGATPLTQARAGQSVTVTLADERDLSRGDVILSAATAGDAVAGTGPRELVATVCWLSDTPPAPGRTWALRHLTRETPARIEALEARLDVHALAWQPGGRPPALNDLVRLRLRTREPLCAAPYARSRAAGGFILVDTVTRATVAAGLIE